MELLSGRTQTRTKTNEKQKLKHSYTAMDLWILYSQAEECHREISREAHKRQTEERKQRTTAEEKHPLHYVFAHLDRLSLTWIPARKIMGNLALVETEAVRGSRKERQIHHCRQLHECVSAHLLFASFFARVLYMGYVCCFHLHDKWHFRTQR